MENSSESSANFSLHLRWLSDEYETVLLAKSSLVQENTKLREKIQALVSPDEQPDRIGEVVKAAPVHCEEEYYPHYRFSQVSCESADCKIVPDSLAADNDDPSGLEMLRPSGTSGDLDEVLSRLQDIRQDYSDPALGKQAGDLCPKLREFPEDFNDAVLGERLPHSLPRRQLHSDRPADKHVEHLDIAVDIVDIQMSDDSEDELLDIDHHMYADPIRAVEHHVKLFPDWFDPGPSACEEQFIISSYHVTEMYDQTDKSCCIVAPTNRKRLFWDACAFVVLLVQMWLTPFELIFLDDPAPWMRDFELALTFFWLVDILLNFCTGYIHNDVVVMSRCLITKKYLRCWFWVDLVATLPFDLLLEAVAGNLFQMSRLGRASKFMKTFRYLKMVRALRMMRKLKQAQPIIGSSVFLQKLKLLSQPAGVLMFFACFAHIHGCVWALTQSDRVSAREVSEAFRNYYASFSWAYMGLTAASFREAEEANNGSAWWLEAVISTERIVLIVLAAKRVIFHSLRFIDEAHKAQTEQDVLEYLRMRKVGFQTQIQVLFSLKDSGTAKQQRRRIEELLNLDLPPELQRAIHKDLWSRHLKSLGLIVVIQAWNPQFIGELSQLVDEVVFASRCILCRRGESAFAAYHILRGELRVLNYFVGEFGEKTLPNFHKGHWVGENALVSSILKCSATFVTLGISSFMVLRGDLFQGLISRLGLMEDFQMFCSEQLWRGMCGRCGQLGTHFSDSCHTRVRRHASMTLVKQLSGGLPVKNEERSKRKRLSQMQIPSMFQAIGSKTSVGSEVACERTIQIGSDLKEFLNEVDIPGLASVMSEMEIYSLDELIVAERNEIMERLIQHGGNGIRIDVLEQLLEKALSVDYIHEFNAGKAERVHQALFTAVSRLQHLVFLSHYKIEAGTEAALMRTELEQCLSDDDGGLGHFFDEPVFLDSENLFNLEDLQQRVRNTHNLVLLLTKGVLTRPWVLIEILTARREGVRILLVNVSKPGESAFVFPDDAFFNSISDGSCLDEDARELLQGQGYTLTEVEETLRAVFQSIAVPYSPHKATNIRRAEIAALVKQCRLKESRNSQKAAEWGGSDAERPQHKGSVTASLPAAMMRWEATEVERRSHKLNTAGSSSSAQTVYSPMNRQLSSPRKSLNGKGNLQSINASLRLQRL